MRRLGFGFFLVRARKNALLVPAICVADAVLAPRLLDPFKLQVRHEWTLG
jgi:hypothetical protein